MFHNNFYTRMVLVEKFTLKDSKLLPLKEKLYNSIIESKKRANIPNEFFIECISAMCIQEFEHSKYQYLGIIEKGQLFHAAFEKCLKGFKTYRDEGDYQSCYKYFVTLMMSEIYNK